MQSLFSNIKDMVRRKVKNNQPRKFQAHTPERVKFFEQEARNAGTDKLSHGYMFYYAKYMPLELRSLLEIGVERGKSCVTFDSIFGKDTLDYHVVDLFKNPDFKSARWCRNRGYAVYEGDQSDTTFLYTIKKMFPIIIEDGSHVSRHQIETFKHLFTNNLDSGGYYFLEDAQCCLLEHYWGYEVESYNDTALSMFKHYIKTRAIVNKFFSEGEAAHFESNIDWVEITANEKLIIIKKK